MNKLALWLGLALVWFYRLAVSPFFRMLGARCRYHPSCSEFARAALYKWGPWAGSRRAARRLLSCHPWGGAGGVEYP